MTPAVGLFHKITSFDNLLLAAKKARRGKRWRSSTVSFDAELEKNIMRLRHDLESGEYRCGRYRQFYVQESKKRQISAAPYRDRVVHHALCNIIEPIFDRAFIYDSYACRKGKGTHKAVERFSSFLRNPENKYVLKFDIRRYFPSIDHGVLLEAIKRKIACPKTLSLIGQIIESGRSVNAPNDEVRHFPGDDLFTPLERAKGIPIGNLTSQFFANIYLDGFDHWMKETMRCQYYIRYVDDFVIAHSSKSFLNELRQQICHFLESVRLTIHEDKSQVMPSSQGLDFLGYRVFPEYRLVRKSNVIRYKRKLRNMQKVYAAGTMNFPDIRQRLISWIGHVKWAHSYRLRRNIFDNLAFVTGDS